ncbi:MAG: hypothetical protein E7324_05265 [Clostridiales bacterium]|nr:hypothetical protein [Clostridiales bacterium]
MDNRILAGLMAEYEHIRQENAREEARRQQEMADHHPDLFVLMEQRHQMVMQAARSVFADPAHADPAVAMAGYNEKIAALLEKKGYPRDYLFPIYRCSQCQDQGHYYDEGSRQVICPCLQKAYHAALAQSGLGSNEEPSFARFDATRIPDAPLPGTDVTQREYMEIIRKKCLAFAENLPHGPVKTLLLHGGSGLGKTYLLRCVGNHARQMGVDTLETTAYDLLMALKNAYFSRTGETAQEYFDVPLLLIDDLGMEPLMEGVTVEQIYHLINSRLSRGLYTVITTNLSRTELQQRYTERVSSRLLDARTGLTLPFLGKDIRLIK